jgi:hypothetical protein
VRLLYRCGLVLGTAIQYWPRCRRTALGEVIFIVLRGDYVMLCGGGHEAVARETTVAGSFNMV